VKLDPDAARAVAAELKARLAKVVEEERQSRMFQVIARAGQATAFRAIGVQILPGDETVYTVGFHSLVLRTNSSRPLGALAGAEALVTDGAQAGALAGQCSCRSPLPGWGQRLALTPHAADASAVERLSLTGARGRVGRRRRWPGSRRR
jgi:hypothetical protein